MPRPLALFALVVLIALTAAVGAGPARAAWRWPVHGRVAGAFAYDRRVPFLAGQRRGIDLAARGGAPVRAPCRGRVLFAGRLPRGGLGLTLACGSLRATLLGLARLAVRRGAVLPAGAAVGVAAAGRRLRLGARRAGTRFGYVDPALLLADEPVRAPRVGPPIDAGRRRRPAPPVAVVAPPLPAPAPLRAPAPARAPASAWAGLVLVAAGLPLGALVRRGRRRRRERQRSGVAASARRAG
jgi:hypothetical protein